MSLYAKMLAVEILIHRLISEAQKRLPHIIGSEMLIPLVEAELEQEIGRTLCNAHIPYNILHVNVVQNANFKTREIERKIRVIIE